MEEIFKQYSGPIITAVVVVALIIVLAFVIGTNEGGTVGTAFHDLLLHFFDRADNVLAP